MSAEATLSEDAKALEYYKAAAEKRRPLWVPESVLVLHNVRGDLPFLSAGTVKAGLHDAHCNQWGAVSAMASDGKLLGLKPAEFEVVSWKRAEVKAG